MKLLQLQGFTTDAEAELEEGGVARPAMEGDRFEGEGGGGENEAERGSGDVEGEAPPEKKKRDPSTYSLVEAAQYGVLERCRELVEREGKDVTKADCEGITPLHWAAINNRIALARLVEGRREGYVIRLPVAAMARSMTLYGQCC